MRERAGVWLHVDAAGDAAAAAATSELRWSLAVQRADSVVVNSTSWLFTPVDCSALWTRRPDALRAAFGDGHDLASTAGAVDFKDHGPALGRRALKLWAVLRCYGSDAFGR